MRRFGATRLANWLGSCHINMPFPLMGINAAGLAVAMNNADAYDGWNNCGLNTSMIARIILENCANVDEAAELLEKIRLAGAYYHKKTGSMLFLADRQKAYLSEFCALASQFAVMEFGYVIRANSWRLPGVTALSKHGSKHLANDAFREYQVRDVLNEAMRHGGVRVEDCFAASRLRGGDVKAGVFPVCWESSTAFATCQPDAEFPELSTFYLASGPPRNSVVIAVSFAAQALPLEMYTGNWTAKAQRFKAEAGMDHNKMPEIERLEQELLQEYRLVRERARVLLRENNPGQAQKIMRENLAGQLAKAEKFFDGLLP